MALRFVQPNKPCPLLGPPLMATTTPPLLRITPPATLPEPSYGHRHCHILIIGDCRRGRHPPHPPLLHPPPSSTYRHLPCKTSSPMAQFRLTPKPNSPLTHVIIAPIATTPRG